jgi:GDPmannose 4,6-dehydratase
MKSALIIGANGQDGQYLSEFLLKKGYKVCGLVRYHSGIQYVCEHPNYIKVYGDVLDSTSISNALKNLKDCDVIEVYNLAAQSHSGVSYVEPEYTADVDALGPMRILQAIKDVPNVKFFQPGSAEMFGISYPEFAPITIYSISKLFAYNITKYYRDTYRLFACNAIMFNHESEKRGPDFVTRKITRGIARWLKDKTPIELGNIDTSRDWGHAEDYVRAMWLMLQHDKPDDYVIGTGQRRTVREFIEVACEEADVKLLWSGSGVDEVATDLDGNVVIKINPVFYRPVETTGPVANPEKARCILGWEPNVTFREMVRRMLIKDIQSL